MQAAFRAKDPETLELEARCILTSDHVDTRVAHERVLTTLRNATCWNEPPRLYQRVDRLYTDDVRVSDFGDRQEVLRKVALVTSDLPPASEYWKAPDSCPRYRIRLSRETPATRSATDQPMLVRRKNTLSCMYKDYKFDVSLVEQGGRSQLELEVECQSLDGGEERTQQHLVMKLTDLVQMAYGV